MTPPRMRARRRKPIPPFATEDEERSFWSEEDVTDYFDLSKARVATFPNLKPSTATISLRLPQAMLDELKVLANQRDVPYQSLLKVFLADRIAVERERSHRRRRVAS